MSAQPFRRFDVRRGLTDDVELMNVVPTRAARLRKAGMIGMLLALSHSACVHPSDLQLIVGKDNKTCAHMKPLLERRGTGVDMDDDGQAEPAEFAAIRWRTVKEKYFTVGHGAERVKLYRPMRVTDVDVDNDGTAETVIKVSWRRYDSVDDTVYILPKSAVDLGGEVDAEQLQARSTATVFKREYPLMALPARVTSKSLGKFGAPMTKKKVDERLVEVTDVSYFDLFVYEGRTYWTFSSNVTIDGHEAAGIRQWRVIARMNNLEPHVKSLDKRFEDICYFVSR